MSPLAPHPIATRRAPWMPGPACQSRASAPRRPRRPPLSRGDARRPGAVAGYQAVPPAVPRPPRSPPLRLHAYATSPPAPLKKGNPAATGQVFLQRAMMSPLRFDDALQPPPSPPLQATGPPRRSPEPSLPRRRPPPLCRRYRPAPARRATARVSPASTPPARRHPGTPPVLVDSTLPPASPHRAAVERVTTPTRARTARGDRAASARRASRAARPGPSRLVGRPPCHRRGPFSPARCGPDFGPTLCSDF
jgi:hypothetical protein